MLETIFDIAEAVFSVGMGVLNKTSEGNTKKRNDTFFNYLVNMAMADREIKPEEKKFLDGVLKDFTFEKYANKDVNSCIDYAIKNRLKISEIAKVFSKEDRKEQLAIYKIGILLSAVDRDVVDSEISILRELAGGLNLTQKEINAIIDEVKSGK